MRLYTDQPSSCSLPSSLLCFSLPISPPPFILLLLSQHQESDGFPPPGDVLLDSLLCLALSLASAPRFQFLVMEEVGIRSEWTNGGVFPRAGDSTKMVVPSQNVCTILSSFLPPNYCFFFSHQKATPSDGSCQPFSKRIGRCSGCGFHSLGIPRT